jgi:transposase
MLAEILLPNTTEFVLNGVTMDDAGVKLDVSSIQTRSNCPICSSQSDRVHSHYYRTLADLPCAGHSMGLLLRVRRFFCDNPWCTRRIFAERMPDFVDPWARRTLRLAERQRQLGLALGGEAAKRLADYLMLPVSGDTLLRLVMDGSAKEMVTPRVLGVDDWAWCKGQKYGTILVDLERRCVVDLLPDRSADSLAGWLQAHPGVEIISRDRALAYIEGITRGAPDAIQVADRWHLLVNLREALERLLDRNRECLQAAATPEEEPAPDPTPLSQGQQKEIQPIADLPPTRVEVRRQLVRERRLARYQAVILLHEQGVKIRAIARHLGMGRQTVRRYINAGAFPEMAKRRKRPSILDLYLPFLHRRWAEGVHNGSQLYREIKAQGYAGSRSFLGHWVARKRKSEPSSKGTLMTDPKKCKSPVPRFWSARRAVWLLLREPEELTSEQDKALGRMLKANPIILPAYNLAQSFGRIVRQQYSKALEAWLKGATESGILELRRFASSLKKDQEAIVAALSLPWSNGQVEGQINRLKLIKRQMYGRAHFDLLRRRVLAT